MTRNPILSWLRLQVRIVQCWLWPDKPLDRLQTRSDRLAQRLRSRYEGMVGQRRVIEGLEQRLIETRRQVRRMEQHLTAEVPKGDAASVHRRLRELEEARYDLLENQAAWEHLEQAYRRRLDSSREIKDQLRDLQAQRLLALPL